MLYSLKNLVIAQSQLKKGILLPFYGWYKLLNSNDKKTKMLKTRNIFIDTEVFVSNNFFQNKNLQRLAEFGNSETVNIYLTEITKNEIQSNIKENLMTAQQEINNFKKIISNKGKILKNLQNFKPYIDLPKLEVNLNFDELSVELENFIKEGKVKFIAFELANITDVVNNYFNQKPPFSLGKKNMNFQMQLYYQQLKIGVKKKMSKSM